MKTELIKIPAQNSVMPNNNGISLSSATPRVDSYSLGNEPARDQGCTLSTKESKKTDEDKETPSTNTMTTGGSIAATTGFRE